MITLCMDTSFHFLTLVLIKDSQMIASIQEEAYRVQSETILSRLDELFKQTHFTPKDISEIVITDGPGSYTGLRISMSIAKTLATIANIKIYTLSSLHVLAGQQKSVGILVDARAQRVYFGHYDLGLAVFEDAILTLEEVQERLIHCDQIYGHLNLIHQMDRWPNYAQHFIELKEYWKEVKDVLTLSPRYFKEHEAYQK